MKTREDIRLISVCCTLVFGAVMLGAYASKAVPSHRTWQVSFISRGEAVPGMVLMSTSKPEVAVMRYKGETERVLVWRDEDGNINLRPVGGELRATGNGYVVELRN